MNNYPDNVTNKIVSVAREREMTFAQVESALENYNRKMSGFIPNENVAPYQVELAVTYADVNDPGMIVKPAQNLLQRIAATYWADAAGAHIPDALRYFDRMEKWDASLFASIYPVTLPTTPEGMIDARRMALYDQINSLQRALMFDTQAEIALASTQGGDDTWFDYLPNGILQLSSLQSEGWETIWADIWNNHPYGTDRYYGDDTPDDEQEALDDVEERLAEQYGFYLQDVTSGFHSALFRKR
jgi:hypothetical protein